MDEWMNTLNQVMQLNTLVFQSPHLEDGKRMDSSQQLELKKMEVSVDTVYNLLKEQLLQYFKPQDRKLLLSLIQKRETTSIVALVRTNRKTIYRDKKSILNPFIRPTQLLKILEAVLTTNEKVYFPLLRTQVKDLSAKLSWHTKTDCVDMDSNSSSISSPYTASTDIESKTQYRQSSLFCKKVNSLPTKNLAKTCSTSFMYLPVEQMVRENIQDRKKTRKMNKVKRVIQITKPRCEYICKKKIDGTYFGRECGIVLMNGETVCSKHLHKKDNTHLDIWPYVCKHVICQEQGKDRSKSKKGLECGEICEENRDRCKSHEKCIVQVVKPEDCKILRFTDNEDKVDYKIMYPPYKEKATIIRCFHVRARLSKEQMRVYSKIAGDCRKTYNILVSRQEEFNSDDLNVMKLRSGVVNQLPEELEYLAQSPKDCRDFAAKEFVTSFMTSQDQYNKKIEARSKYEEWCKENEVRPKPWKEIKKPEIMFRRKREDQSINIEKRAVTIRHDCISIYPTYFHQPILLTRRTYRKKNNGKIRDKKWSELLNKGLFHDIKLIRKKSGRYYFAIPYDKEKENVIPNGEFCSADPGLKTFLTTYDSDNKCVSYGEGTDKKLYRLHAELDRIKSLRARVKRNDDIVYKKLDKFIAKKQEHINDSVKDLHYKTIKELRDYKVFYLPKFNSTQMSKRRDSRGFVKRSMLSLAHYKFYLRLKTKAEETGVKVYRSDEFRTTMVCTNCLRMNRKVEGNRWFKCNYCPFEWDRDCNASRNNKLKYCLCPC